MIGLHFADIFEAIADAEPDARAVVQGDRMLTWADYDDQAARLAGTFGRHGVAPGAKVGILLYNAPEYLVTQYAAFKARLTPVNVNYRYREDELAYLLDNAECEAVVFHTSLGGPLARILDRLPRVRLLVGVDDGGGGAVPAAIDFADAVATAPAPRQARCDDDLYMLYTGGTTGMPKGVMYAMGPFTAAFAEMVAAGVGRAPFAGSADLAANAVEMIRAGTQQVALPACPLMHGTGVWLGGLLPHLMGSTVVLLAGRSFDAHELWRAVEREAVTTVVLVGDAFGRPMLQALRDGGPYDTTSVNTFISTGAVLSAEVKEGLLAHAQGAVIMDVLGSTEGAMGQHVAVKGAVGTTATFRALPTTRVLRADDTEVEPGSGEVGVVAVCGSSQPIGYFKDEAKTRRTFRTIDGVRYSFPGDMATVDADGSITLLGRGATCINTGGEKVFPEEVEEIVKTHPAVVDCLVFGVPDERYGQRVVGIFAAEGDGTVRPQEVVAHTAARLAGYKVPRDLLPVGAVPRGPNGKADYRAARELFGDRRRDGGPGT